METKKRKEEGRESVCYSVDSFANGIAFGGHQAEVGGDPRDHYSLRLVEGGEVVRLRSRYLLKERNPLHELELQLMRLSSQGTLGRSSIYFGVSTDPFYPFDGKFDATMKFLQLFQRYTPGQLIVQTRSPLIVIAMPVLRGLGKHASVTIGIETPDQEVAQRYTPGLPRVEERLRAATTLRRMGVEVTLQCAPVLPYGDWKGDAKRFAQTLCDHGDYVYVQPLSDGSEATERRIRATPIARKLAQDRKFHWLRKDAATPLLTEIEKLAAPKLVVPERKHLKQKQLSVFVA